jgi:cytochrome c-type biogenesis protein CcmH/NrfG
MTGSTSDTRNRKAAERELLARLGLTEDANTQMIEAAHDELVEYLEKAPGDLRSWARREIAAADEAYALLLDPTEGLTDAVAASIAPAAAVAAAPATKPAARPAAPVAAAVVVDEDGEEIEELSDEPVPVRKARATTRAAAAAPASADTVARNRLITRLALVAAGLVGVGVIVFAVYSFGGGSGVPGMNGTPAPEANAGAAASPAVDQAAVGALMAKLQADPKDTQTLIDLGNVYYNGADYATSGTFFDKALAVDPKNVDALLGRGATAYNVGDRAVAEKDWQAAIAADPTNADAHYYLGFLYLDQASPDIAKVKVEWNKVIELAPGSDFAKLAQQHLTSFESPAPGGSAAPVSSVAPAASPAASPSASGN